MNPQHFKVCPYDSPWQSEVLEMNQMNPGPALNLDTFIPLKDLLDGDLHQLKSNGSDQSGYTSFTDVPNVRSLRP